MGQDRRNRKKDFGGKRQDNREVGMKGTLYAVCVIVLLGIIAFFGTILIYNKNLEKVYGDLEMQEIGQTSIDDDYSKTEEASSGIGKNVMEVQETDETNTENSVENLSTQEIEDPSHNVEEENNTQEEPTVSEDIEENEETEIVVPDPVFSIPVEGEIKKEFATDSLVYSETLKEWVTHTGIDIEAEKRAVVKASESGKVTAIKNDPRYGITVIIEHSNGYETRYANLLTAEFVKVGEEVTKGQTIGTVGDTATFEVLDNYHLHFEILKNGEYQNPSSLLNM